MFWRKKKRNTDSRGKIIPFTLHTESDMEHYRADTFYTKEPETLVWIDGIKPNSIFIDVGANIGVYSLYCAKTKPYVPVYAFEPMLENFRRLVDNRLLNECHNLTPINMGMGKNGALVKFFVRNSVFGESGSQIDAPIDETGCEMGYQREDSVLVTSFDSFVDKLPPDKRVYLKIDVDGHEMDVLRGISRNFSRLYSVLIEVNNSPTLSVYKAKDRYVGVLMKTWGLVPDNRINNMHPHSSDRRKGNPINVVYTRR